jgi:ribosomal protein S18 acetylase RimI-like enzyme
MPDVTDSIELRRVQEGELGMVAGTHRAAFPDSPLSRLGAGAVARFYLSQLRGPHQPIVLGAFGSGRCLGVIIAGDTRHAMRLFLCENRFFLTRQVLMRPGLLWDRLVRARVGYAVRAWFHPPVASSNRQSPTNSSFRILSIGVIPEARGSGVAKKLMSEVERLALDSGVAEMGLTVGVDNDRAIRFYEGMGWERILIGGRWRGLMVKRLRPRASG